MSDDIEDGTWLELQIAALKATVARQQAQVERLRAALRSIIAADRVAGTDGFFARLARRTLEGNEQ